MAKVTNEAAVAKEETKAVTTADVNPYEGFTEEEIQEMLNLTGQAANVSFDRFPVLKVNQISSDVQDDVPEGKRVKMGNFVLNQVTKKVGDNTTIEAIGDDFGASPDITVLKVAKQYFYWPADNDVKKMCTSQLLLEAGERPIGSRLGFDCADRTCPMRNMEKDGCKCQIHAYSEVGPESIKAVYTAKGDSFIPFDNYMKQAEAVKTPLFFCPTKLTTVKKTNGSNTYWVITPVLQADKPYTPEEKRRLFGEAKKLDEAIRGQKESRKAQQLTRQTEQRKQLPVGMTIEPPFSGGAVTGGTVGGALGNVTDAEFADVEF